MRLKCPALLKPGGRLIQHKADTAGTILGQANPEAQPVGEAGRLIESHAKPLIRLKWLTE